MAEDATLDQYNEETRRRINECEMFTSFLLLLRAYRMSGTQGKTAYDLALGEQRRRTKYKLDLSSPTT